MSVCQRGPGPVAPVGLGGQVGQVGMGAALTTFVPSKGRLHASGLPGAPD